MDRIALATLQAEVEADARVFQKSVALAREQFGDETTRDFDGCGLKLVGAYNSLEQACLRIAKAFENHIDDERGWHGGLLRRLSIEIPGVRPAFFPPELMPPLQDLRSFRHLLVHAYDLTIQAERFAPILREAGDVASRLNAIVADFFARAGAE